MFNETPNIKAEGMQGHIIKLFFVRRTIIKFKEVTDAYL